MVSQGSATSPARLPTGVLSAPVVDDRLRQRATTTRSGANAAIAGGSLAPITTESAPVRTGTISVTQVVRCDWSGSATTDRRRPARPLLAVCIHVVAPAIGVHDIRTVMTGIPRAVVAAAAVTDVATPTTRGAESVAGGRAATAVNATDVDLHYGSPTTTAISWPHAAACSRPVGCRLCIVSADTLVVGKRHIRAVGAASPRATSANITGATVATTEVASSRNNVLRCAGAKGIVTTSSRFSSRSRFPNQPQFRVFATEFPFSELAFAFFYQGG